MPDAMSCATRCSIIVVHVRAVDSSKQTGSKQQFSGEKKTTPKEPRMSVYVLELVPVFELFMSTRYEPAPMSLRYQFQIENICQVCWS